MNDPEPRTGACLGIIESDDLPNVIRSTVGARMLWDLGCTVAEIAGRLGLSEADVAALPEMSDAALGSAHVARAEAALLSAAVGATVVKRRTTSDGRQDVTTAQLPPDPAAARTILENLAPDRWGKARDTGMVYVVQRYDDAPPSARLVRRDDDVLVPALPDPSPTP